MFVAHNLKWPRDASHGNWCEGVTAWSWMSNSAQHFSCTPFHTHTHTHTHTVSSNGINEEPAGQKRSSGTTVENSPPHLRRYSCIRTTVCVTPSAFWLPGSMQDWQYSWWLCCSYLEEWQHGWFRKPPAAKLIKRQQNNVHRQWWQEMTCVCSYCKKPQSG